MGPRLADFDPGYNSSIARALRASGLETAQLQFFVPTPPGLINRLRIDGGRALGYTKYFDDYIKGFNARVVATYRSFRPDLVLVIRGTSVSAETLGEMKGAVRALWLHDRALRCGLERQQMHAYEHRFVFEATDVTWFRETEGLTATFLPMAYDPTVYRPLTGVRQDIDLSFVGAYYPARRALLEKLARDFKGRRFRFYGRHVRYREPKTWIKALGYLTSYGFTFANRSLDAAEINVLYARSKMCLNIHHEQNHMGCNPRVFEIMGAGAYQVVDSIPYVRDNFAGMVSIYGDYQQLCHAIEATLADGARRRALAEEGRRFVLGAHTFQHRIRSLLEHVGMMDAVR